MPEYQFLTDLEIEDYAAELRRFWGLKDGPVSNVVWLLEKNGILVSRTAMLHEGLDATSGWYEPTGRPIVLLGTEKASAVRSRFDAAHELGHLILHRNVSKGILDKETPGYRTIEKQAHRFAGAFLFPRQSFMRDVFFPKLDVFRALKKPWMVSIGMMIKRAFDLGLISEKDQSSLFKNYARRGWRTDEPLDNEFEIEKPNLLLDAVSSLVENGLFTKSGLREHLRLPRADMEQLCGLVEGFLVDDPPKGNIISLGSTG